MARVCRGTVAVSVWDVPEANPVLGLFGPIVQSLGTTDVAPPGPDSHFYSDAARLGDLLRRGGLIDVAVDRVTWTFAVNPAAWFDAVAAGTPRTGAVLAAATEADRATLRARYVELATTMFGCADGSVILPAAAVVGGGRSNLRPRT